MTDTSHLDALQLRLSHECAKTEQEREMRRVWVAQIEKEIGRERDMSDDELLIDDELLAELMS